jgi:signal transduction histidine kinase
MTPSRPLPLRTQLLLAFATVAVVALAAATAAVVALMLDYRAQAVTQRLRDAAGGAGGAASVVGRSGGGPAAIAAGVAAQVPIPHARVLVLDTSGTVVAEAAVNATGTGAASTTEAPASGIGESATADAPAGSGRETLFIGRRLELPHPGVTPGDGRQFPGGRGRSPQEPTSVWRGDPTRGYGDFIFVAAPMRQPPPSQPSQTPQTPQTSQGPGPGPGAGPGGEAPPPSHYHRVVLAIPEDTLPTAWEELAPGVAAALATALLAAGAVAWRLTTSIARPIRAVTGAAERIARGEPHRPIPEAGTLEVAQLARSFNTMVDAVERSHRTLREFVANASHELRTPLTAIQGFSQAVEDGVLDAPEPTRDAVRHIHREAERMRRLVEDLLLLSRVEARDREPSREPVDLAALLDTLAQRVRPLVHERGQTLELRLPDHLVTTGNAMQLEHLFKNLLDNAVKHAPAGAAITVRASSDPTGVSVAVHNTGSVIAPEDRPHVFERFYRADKSRSRTVGAVAGSGLGLAIAQEVAQRHGGAITLESAPQTGTTFTVTLAGDSPRDSAATRGERAFAPAQRRAFVMLSKAKHQAAQ